MLIGRDAEINLLNQYYMRADDQVMIMYGLEGVGKSTLVRCLNLLEKPSSGRVIIDNEDMASLSEICTS